PPPRSRRGSPPRWSCRSAPPPPRLLAPPRSSLHTPPPCRSGHDPSNPPSRFVIVPQTPSPRGFFSAQAYVVESELEPRRAIAEVAANSRSDSQFPRKFPLGTVSRLSSPAGVVMGAGSERTPTLPVGRPRRPSRDSSGRFSVKASRGSRFPRNGLAGTSARLPPAVPKRGVHRQ